MHELGKLEPRGVWSIFFEVCAIPHPSHHEEALALWALERARRDGFEAFRDSAGNVLIRKPASPGHEGAKGVILQAHLDMVPQRTGDSSHDFLRDPILPRIDPADPHWLRATGTTLGADDGIGIAAGFALLEDAQLHHGKLELLLTVNEEDGMSGAHDLAQGLLSGNYLLNLDGEREEELGVGSAGSRRVHFSFSERALPPEDGLSWIEVRVFGLRGGHSGGDIHLGRANAVRALLDLIAPEAASISLARIEGGSLPNAIAREAGAILGLPSAGLEGFLARLETRRAGLESRFRTVDPGLRVAVEAVPAPEAAALSCLDNAAGARVLAALDALPDGCFSLLEGMADVARLSSNLGALATRCVDEGDGSGARLLIEGKILTRAAFDAERATVVAEIEGILRAGGATVELRPELSAWSPDLKSPLLAAAKRSWLECRGEEAGVRATHGGLECSLIRLAYPGLDMLSVGPTIRFPHSPDEAVHIASVGRFMEAARRLVERLAG